MSGLNMRGLTNFIQDIRNATTKEQEQKRVEKELAKIREKFGNDDKMLGYDRKKYVWKLLYMYMLGYDIEFGHMEALRLITSTKYSEKQAGYMACQLLWNENTEFLRLMVQTVKKDLNSGDDAVQCLALAFIANIGGNEFAEALATDVQQLLISGSSRSFVRKKAALCLLRLFRRYPDCVSVEEIKPKLLNLLDDPQLGVALSASTLLLGLVSHQPQAWANTVPDRIISLLSRLLNSRDKKSIYRYYLTLCPWLQVKCLRILQYFPYPDVSEKNTLLRLQQCLTEILTKTVMTKNTNKNQADHAILFECVNLIIHYAVKQQQQQETSGQQQQDPSHKQIQDFLQQSLTICARFLSSSNKEANFKYLAMETLAKTAFLPTCVSVVKKYQVDIVKSLLGEGVDISIRKKALELLFIIADKSNGEEIINTLLTYLMTNAAFEIKEELVLKIAILAEKFSSSLKFYVDVVLKLIVVGGENVSDDVWFRVVQIVTNNEELQEYAATVCYQFLSSKNDSSSSTSTSSSSSSPSSFVSWSGNEMALKVAAYILGEFSDQIKDRGITGLQIFELLASKYPTATNSTKALLLSAFVKLANTYASVSSSGQDELKQRVIALLAKERSHIDMELQQRATEYHYLLTGAAGTSALCETVFEVMPPFPERENVLLRRLKKRIQSTDRDAFDALANSATSKDEDEEEESEEESSEEESDEDDDEEEPGKTAPTQPAARSGFDLASSAASLNLSSSSSSSSLLHFDYDFQQQQKLFPDQLQDTVLSLLGKESGVLYECPLLQIGFKMSIETQNGVAKIAFYLGNKSKQKSDILSNVTLIVQEQTQEGTIQQCFTTIVKPAEPISVGAQQQQPIYCLFTCLRPFRFPVVAKLTFDYPSANGTQQHLLRLQLPLMLSSFFQPTPELRSDQFIAAWTKFPHEISSTRYIENKAPDEEISVDSLIFLVTSIMKMSIIEGVEKNPNNFVAASLFCTGTKHPQQPQQNVTMPTMIRVETRPKMNLFRLTIHSAHISVCQAFLQTFAVVSKSLEKK